MLHILSHLLHGFRYIVNAKRNYDGLIRLDDGVTLNNEYKNLLSIMNIGLPSGDWIAPLLSFYDKFGSSYLTEFLKKLEYKFSSDWILQYTPTQRINNMNDILKEIDRCNYPKELLTNVSIFKVKADQLRNILNGEVYRKRFAKYILLKYEYLQSDNTVHLSNFKTISVEHVLPQNPKDNSMWISTFPDESRKKWTHRLANLILISKRKNSKLSNLDFDEKKERYLKGRIDIFISSKVFLSYEEWDTSLLQKRQDEILHKLVH